MTRQEALGKAIDYAEKAQEVINDAPMSYVDMCRRYTDLAEVWASIAKLIPVASLSYSPPPPSPPPNQGRKV